jgi:predicted GIY-YIG superfamily endonuclease
MIYSIYTLSDPRDGIVFYVGITNGPLSKRLYGHTVGKITYKTPKDGYVRMIQEDGAEPAINCIDSICDNKEDALILEMYWINKLRAAGHPLQNIRMKYSVKAKMALYDRFGIIIE